MVRRDISVDPLTGGDFEVELSLDEIPPMKSRFPESPVGHELAWFWTQTVEKDVGLEVVSVELLASKPSHADGKTEPKTEGKGRSTLERKTTP